MNYPLFFRLMFKDLSFDKGRSILTIISQTAVIVCFLSTVGFSAVLKEFGAQPQSSSQILMIISDYALDPMQSKLDESVILKIADLVHQEFGMDSLESIYPVIYRTMEMNDKTIRVIATPLEELRAERSMTLTEGNWPTSNDQVLVSQVTREVYKWKIGDQIMILGNPLIISGLANEESIQSSTIWMNFDEGQILFDLEDDFQIGILRLASNIKLQEVQSYLQQNPEFPQGYAIYLNQQVYGRYAELVQDLGKVAFILSAIAFAVIILGTYNATCLTVVERKRDMAILETVGFASKKINLFLLVRTFLQTLVSYALAGVMTAFLVQESTRYPIVFYGMTITLKLSASILAEGFLFTIFAAGLGVWLTTRAFFGVTLASQLQD